MISEYPTEDREQMELAAWLGKAHPGLLFFAIPNGGWRHKATAARMKATGVKAGVPDLFIAAARPPYHGLFIELKRIRGGRLSSEQERWISGLRHCGYAAAVCYGAEDAKERVRRYLAPSLPPAPGVTAPQAPRA